MVELCGAGWSRGRSTRRPRSRRRTGAAARAAAPSGCWECGSQPRSARPTSSGSGSSVERDGEDLDATCRSTATTTSPARPTWSRRSGRIHGYDAHLPRLCPRRPARAAASPASRAAPPRRGRHARPRLRRSRHAEPHRPGDAGAPAVPTAIRARRRSGLQPALAGALRAADDPARHPARRRRATTSPTAPSAWRCSSPAAPTSREGEPAGGGVLGGRFAGERPAPAFEPHRIGCLAVGPLTRRAGAATNAGRLLRAQGRARGAGRPARRRGRGRAAASRSCTRAARRGARRRRARAGSASCTRSSAAPGTSSRRRLRGRSGAAGRRVVLRRRDLEDVISFPAVHQDLAVVVPEDVDAARVRAAVLEGGGELLRARRDLRRLSRRAGRRGAQEPGAAARVPRRRPHADRRGGRRAREAITEALAEIGGSLRE